MNPNDFINIKVIAKGQEEAVKIQKGCSFENNGAIYHVNNDGQLTIFNKSGDKWEKADKITMTGYQFSVFKAVANNEQEINGKNKIGDIVLSKTDIEKSIEQYRKNIGTNKENALKTDLSAMLPEGYKIEKPMIYSNHNSISAYVDSGNKNTSGTVVFGYTSQKDAKTISEVVKKLSVQRAEIKESSAKKITPKTESKKSSKTKSRDNSNKISTKKIVTKKTVKRASVADDIAKFTGGHISIDKVKDIKTVAQYTGIPADYIKEILVGIEGKKKKPLLKAEYDKVPGKGHPQGYLTVGFGHTELSGRPIPYEGMKITEKQAYQILANDIIIATRGAKNKVGAESYKKCPKSIQNSLIDLVFNKGPRGIDTHLKANIEAGYHHSAALRTWYDTSVLGLKKRNLYRFIEACKDLSVSEQQSAIKRYYNEYGSDIRIILGYDSTAKKVWNNLCSKAKMKELCT